MLRKFLIVILSYLSTTFLLSQNFEFDNNKKYFSETYIKRYLNFLGSDLLEGRGTGQLGGNLAAKYFGLKFDELNLQPAGDNNTYYQQIPMHSTKVLKGSELLIYNNDRVISLNVFDDYLLYKSGEQTFLPAQTEMVFVGYGITASEFDYNDYANVDISGKIAVMLEGEPISDESNYFDGEIPTIYSYPEAKLRNAISRGAYGCIIISNPQSFSSSFWDYLKVQFSFDDIRLAYSTSSKLSLILHPEKSNFIFENSGYTLNNIIAMHKEHRMESFNLKSSMTFKGKFLEREFFSQNIIGVLEGRNTELKDSYLLITAHYDHLGIGPAIQGDSIYNGVFDNAAGCAALLELARVFTENRHKLKRSVVFMLLTGEENGLLGSNYYVNNPKFPLYKTIANINIDGVASFDRFKSVIAAGIEYSTLDDFLINSLNILDLKLGEIPPQFKSWESFSRSDQIEFAKAGIPSILLLDGVNYENLTTEQGIKKLINYNENIYHTPFDDLSQEINYKAFLQHLELLFHFSFDLVNSDKTPEWKEGAQFINARLRTKAERR